MVFFDQSPEIGLKVAKKWVWGSKSGSKCAETHFLPTLNPFRDIKGPEAAPTQHKDRIKNPRHGQHQNKIRTRYEFAKSEAIKGQDRVAPQYALIFQLS